MISERDFRHPLVGAVGARWPGRTVSADRPLVHVAIHCDAACVDNPRPTARRSQSIEQIERRVEIDAPAQCGLAFSESAGNARRDDRRCRNPEARLSPSLRGRRGRRTARRSDRTWPTSDEGAITVQRRDLVVRRARSKGPKERPPEEARGASDENAHSVSDQCSAIDDKCLAGDHRAAGRRERRRRAGTMSSGGMCASIRSYSCERKSP